MTSVPLTPEGVKQTPIYAYSPASGFNPPYLGYASLEDWARGCTPQLPVYALDMHIPGRAGNGPTIDAFYVTVQQRDAEGVIHYCRLKAGRVQMLHGKPFGGEEEAKMPAIRSLWPIVSEWLREAGYEVALATFAVPQDMQWLDGQAAFLSFDKEAMRYTRKG